MKQRTGFVLVAALWLIVALGAVGLDAALRAKARREPAVYHLDAVRAREAALAGSEYARSRLTAALRERAEELRAQAATLGIPSGNARVQDRLAQTNERIIQRAVSLGMRTDLWREPAGLMGAGMALGDAEFLLDVRDTGMMLNLNEANESMLRNFLALGHRLDYAQADLVTHSILDWRDADDLPRINGGEREEYLDAGAAVLPQNRQFVSVAELRHVLNVTPELFERVAPFLTVSGSGRINVNAAPVEVLLAVPTLTPNVAHEIVRRRQAGQYANNSGELRAMLGNLYQPPTGQELTEFNRRVTFMTNEVEVVSEGRITGSPVHTTVRTILSRATTEAIVVWRRVE